MQFSSDFFSRLTCNVYYDVPRKKTEVTNELFTSAMGINMPTSCFLDVSQCSKLTADVFSWIPKFEHIMYLDLSYTAIDNIQEIASKCWALKSLNLAGTRLGSYKPLTNMISLEVLSLRNSAFQNSTELSTLSCLRCLDLGQTSVTTIAPLNNFTRLEELALDDSRISNDEIVLEQCISTLESMKSLVLLNISETSLIRVICDILDRCNRQLCIESRSRREMFLKAISENNDQLVHRLISLGIDVNQRIGPWADDILSEIYTQRCTRPGGKLQSPFVLPSHQDVLLRPQPIHIALLFNSVDVIKTLLFAGVDLYPKVWFGEVLVEDYPIIASEAGYTQVNCNKLIEKMFAENNFLRSDGRKLEGYDSTALSLVSLIDKRQRLIHNTEKFSKLETNVFSLKEFIKVLFESNNHRLTENMVEKKLTNWKKLCKQISRTLMSIFISFHYRRRDDDPKRKPQKNKGPKSIDNENFNESDDDSDDQNENDVGNQPEGTMDESVTINTFSHGSLLLTDEKADDNASVMSAVTFDPQHVIIPPSMHAPDNSHTNGNDQLQLVDVDDNLDNDDHTAPSIDAEMEEIHDEEGNVIGYKKKKRRHMINRMLSPAYRPHNWREHALVRSINDSPLSVYSLRHQTNVHYLGKKDFTMESRRTFIELRNRREEEVWSQEKVTWNTLSKQKQEYLKSALRFRNLFRSIQPPYYDPNHTEPTAARKDKFLQVIIDREEAKYNYVERSVHSEEQGQK